MSQNIDEAKRTGRSPADLSLHLSFQNPLPLSKEKGNDDTSSGASGWIDSIDLVVEWLGLKFQD